MIAEKVAPFLVKIILIIVFVVDGITKYLLHYSNYSFNILPNRIVKLLIVLLSIIYLFSFWGKITKVIVRVGFLFLSLLFVFGLNSFLYGFDFNYFIKYCCFFLFSIFFFGKIDDLYWLKNVVSTFRYIVIINFLFIVIGILTDIHLFKTYYSRFGYNGLLITSMQSTYIYITAIVLAIKSKDKVFFLISVLSSLVVGTKILLGFLFLVGLYFIWVKIRNKKIGLSLLMSLVIIAVYSFFLLFKQERFKDIIENEGILTAVFSYRNDKLIKVFNVISDIGFNIFSGGVNLEYYRVEMEVVDLVLYFGLMGLIIFFLFFKILNNFFVKDSLGQFYLYGILLFVFLGGNFLYYPINCFVFLIGLKTLSMNPDNKNVISV
ncbi:hypothetical protein [Mangrovimonas sp. DI 80]|uniref:hypothetical protein n=1 Tax=Mangrovimonas sp. DI 80 TaxID=1779330 RepID=UPI00097692BF|nr:hypothetical protein [Mangrovimonas sp. DI 80]OMP32199.1 hypothetical protein BKM32_03880 [Mangrovimonas sp. DI 80]